MAQQSELLHGTLDLLILRPSCWGRRAMASASPAGSAAHRRHVPGQARLALSGAASPGGKGWLSAEWGLSESNRRAKYYRLTKAGKAQFELEVASWGRVAFAINRSLAATS
jgi:hypothetical protein